jgi:ssDNA-binding Zn-finger/Zn-ribbon topoisomerase 1
MATKGTKETFITKARAKHGSVYDYNEVTYTGSKTKVRLICSIHGGFEISPDNHLAGKGCPTCGRIKNANGQRKTKEQFIAEARSVHGNKYDYSRSEYLQARAKVEILCPQHGPFKQEAWSHLSGVGCPRCGFETAAEKHKLNPNDFLERAHAKFGGRFDYSRATYEKARSLVEIGCAVHGRFFQLPVDHLNSTYGCPKCAEDDAPSRGRGPKGPRPESRLGRTTFIERAATTHREKYDYSLVDYKTSKDQVKIICPTHGLFLQVAGSHMAGQGCPHCGNIANGDRQRQSPEEFLKRSRLVHGDKYDYSKMVYRTAVAPITIRCPIHGEFEQTPNTHLKSGCRKCANDDLAGAYSLKVLSRDPSLAARSATLYYLLFESENGECFFKIGITLKTIKQRFAGYGAAGYTFKVLGKKEMSLIDAFKTEQKLVTSHVKAHHYTPLRGNRERTTKFGGRKECFSTALPESLTKLFD